LYNFIGYDSIKQITKGKYEKTKKGNLNVIFNSSNENAKTIMFSCHVDTLGLMISSISANGKINLTQIGGPLINTLNGEYAKVYTHDNQVFEATIISDKPSIHVYPNAKENVNIENLNLRFDVDYKNKQDLNKLGIDNGNYVCYDPKFKISSNGYINSRFLDNKAACAVFLDIIGKLKTQKITLNKNIILAFSTYEEVGHGMSHISQNVDEFIAVDMACIGDN
jgi:putative aminopeptidase FrvX